MTVTALTVLLDSPLPPRTGLHLRMLANLEVVRALGWDSRVLCFGTEDRAPDGAALADRGHGLTDGGRRRPYEAFSVAARVGDRLCALGCAVRGRARSRYPYSLRYDAVDAQQAVVREAVRSQALVVILPITLVHYAPQLVAAGFHVVADAADVLTDLSWRLFSTYGRRRPWRAPSLLINHLACRSQERLFLPSCTEIWVTSAAEADRMRAIAPSGKVIVVPNSIDETTIPLSPAPANEDVGFVGTYSYRPNRDAASYLATRVWPLLRRHRPEARLRLAGSGLPPTAVHRLARVPGVEVCGPVQDSVAFVASCAVIGLPVRLRGGVPLKLVEAMACGRAVVATPELVAGLPVRDGVDVLVRDSPVDFAAALEQLLANPQLAASLGTRARDTFEREFSLSAGIRAVRESSMLGQLACAR